MSLVLNEQKEVTYNTSTNKPDSSHIVMVPSGAKETTPQAYVLAARINGTPIQALCGYIWIPQKDPRNLPVCQACLDIYHLPGENRDDREDLPDA